MSQSAKRWKKSGAFECGDLDGLDPRNALRSYLEQNSFITYGSLKGRDYTHTFLNGGTALIPDDKHATFLQLMADELDAGRKWSVHEQATRFARLYFDLDIEEAQYARDTEIPLSLIRKWVSTLQLAVLEFFPGAKVHSKDPDKTNECGGRVVVLAAPIGYVERKVSSNMLTSAGAVGSGGAVLGKRRIVSGQSTAQRSQRLAIVQSVDTGIAPTQAAVMRHMSEEDKTVNNTVRTMRKTGLHLVFPDILCDMNEMLDVRAHVVDMLQRKFDAPGNQSWEKIVDVQVYTHSCGLRMPGTCKVETCKECGGGIKRRLKCDACNGRPRTFVDRPYKPVMVLGTSGGTQMRALHSLQQSNQIMLEWCTIRRVHAMETKPKFVAPPNARRWSGVRVRYAIEIPSPRNASWANAKLSTTFGGSSCSASQKKGRVRSISLSGDAPADGARVRCGGSSGNIVSTFGPEHEVSHLLELFIQRYTYPCWSDVQVCEVRHILLAANSRFKLPASIYVIKVSGSNECLNIGAKHNSANIYFMAKSDGIEQRCYCRCATLSGRVSRVPCSKFRSNTCEFLQYELGRRLQRRLFPSKHKSNMVSESSTIEGIVRIARKTRRDDSYPSLAEVRRDTHRKRKERGLPTDDDDRASSDNDDNVVGCDDAKSTTPLSMLTYGDNTPNSARNVGKSSFGSTETPASDLDSRLNDERSSTVRKEALMLTKSKKSDDAGLVETVEEMEHMLTNGEDTSAKRPKLRKNSALRREERETYIMFADRDPPKDMQEYKHMLKDARNNLNIRARRQAEKYLEK